MTKTKNLVPRVMLVLFLFLCFQNPLVCDWGSCMENNPVCQVEKGCFAEVYIPEYCRIDCYGGGTHIIVICPIKEI